MKKIFTNNLTSRYNVLIGQRSYKNSYYEIIKLLTRLNFNIESVGFQYWVMALIIYKKNFYRYDDTIETIYSEVAKIFQTTRNNVERDMRTASQEAKKTIANDFEYNKKLTNKTILKLLTHNICLINMKGEK